MKRVTSSNSSTPVNHLHWIAAAGLSAAGLFAAAKLASKVNRPRVSLPGKIALITGGSRGLGLAIAEELGRQGCRIALCARDEDELKRAAEILTKSGIEAATFKCDVAQEDALDPLLTQVLAHFGRIDILVNNAGLIKVAPLAGLEHSDFEEAMNLMFWAPVNLSLKILPHFDNQGGGHIINIASVGGGIAIPHLLPYSCAKFALVGFSTGLGAELDPAKFHVLTVLPGLMRTGSYLHAKFKGTQEEEFAWFSLLGNLPGLSVPVEEAAVSICKALQNRQHNCTISLPAKLLIQSEVLLPEATRTIMQLVNRYLLPKTSKNTGALPGKVLNNRFGDLFQIVTMLGRRAARAFNE